MSVAPVLLFDGDCGFCTTCVIWARRHIHRLDATLPYQHADLASLGISADECERAVQWVGADGTVLSAHLAIAQTLADAGKGWAVVGRAIRLPGLRQISGVVYRWISRNRHRLPGGTPACDLDAQRTPDVR